MLAPIAFLRSARVAIDRRSVVDQFDLADVDVLVTVGPTLGLESTRGPEQARIDAVEIARRRRIATRL